jgi:hypothetical protein
MIPREAQAILDHATQIELALTRDQVALKDLVDVLLQVRELRKTVLGFVHHGSRLDTAEVDWFQ